MNIPINITISILIVLILTLLNSSLEQKYITNKTSKTNVECGFDSNSKMKFNFSNQFFMISIIFLIFDLELIVILPIPINYISILNKTMIMVIILLLLFSLLMEWISGLIEWTK